MNDLDPSMIPDAPTLFNVIDRVAGEEGTNVQELIAVLPALFLNACANSVVAGMAAADSQGDMEDSIRAELLITVIYTLAGYPPLSYGLDDKIPQERVRLEWKDLVTQIETLNPHLK